MHDLQLRDFGTLNVLPTPVVSFLSSHKHLQQATELLFFRAFSYISICHANDNVLNQLSLSEYGTVLLAGIFLQCVKCIRLYFKF